MKATALAQIIDNLLHPWLLLAAGALVLVQSNMNSIVVFALFVVVGMGPGIALDILNFFRTNTERSALDRYAGYVLGFSLLAVVYGSQLIAELKWMYLAMAIAIFYGLIILAEKYFTQISAQAAILIFWATVLMDKVSVYYFLSFLLLLPLVYAEKRLRKNAATAILWGLTIGILAGLFTWL